jgi:bifunctional S24 family peptidase/transcriptional regulator|nr:MAG TPA: Repressor protein CI [Caudoviricetes sp.]
MKKLTKYPDVTTTSKEVFAKNLKHLIKQNGMNYRDFADKTGMKYTTVLDWVNGRTYPRISKLDEIAAFFNVDKADLIEENYYGQITLDLKRLIKETVNTLKPAIEIEYEGYPLEPHNKTFVINTLRQLDLFLQDEVERAKKRKAFETFNISIMKANGEEIKM